MERDERLELERQKLSLISRLSHTDGETLAKMSELLEKLDVSE